MARAEVLVGASPEAVFDVLSDPRAYGHWVVGSREVRGADPDWPAPGTAFDHTVGWGPFGLKDHTEVEEARPPAYLRLRAKARPLPSARVILHLEPRSYGTRVTMIEDPALPLGSVLMGPLGHVVMRARNAESLRRLKELSEGAAPMPGGPLPARR